MCTRGLSTLPDDGRPLRAPEPQERLRAVLERARFVPCALSRCSLEVRDVGENDAWAAAHAGAVPVLTAALPGRAGEAPIPRPPPRVTADKLQRVLEAALADAAGGGADV